MRDHSINARKTNKVRAQEKRVSRSVHFTLVPLLYGAVITRYLLRAFKQVTVNEINVPHLG